MSYIKTIALLCCCLLLSCVDSSTTKVPNIIFILVDDLGVSDVNGFDPLGRGYYETPRIDRLGEEGLKFLHAYANAANCAPTTEAPMPRWP